MPWCGGASGSVRARQIPQSASCASDVQTFCPVSRQPPSTRCARVRSEARSDPAPGSLNSWHQVSSPQQRRAHEPRPLLVAPVPEDRRRRPAADLEVRPLDSRRGELLVDDQLGDGVGGEPVGLGPVGGEVARVDQRLATLGLRAAPRSPPRRRGRRRRTASSRPSRSTSTRRRTPAVARVRQRRCVPVGRAEQAAQAGRPAEVEVRVVLERETDPAEHLDAGLGVADRTVEGDGTRDVGGVRPLLVVGERDRGDVPRRRGDRLGGLEHLGAQVLDRPGTADLLPELLAHAGVVDGRLEAPAGDAGRLRGGERQRRTTDQLGRQLVDGRRIAAVDRDQAAEPARQVETGRELDLAAARGTTYHRSLVGEQQVGGRGRVPHRRRRAGESDTTAPSGEVNPAPQPRPSARAAGRGPARGHRPPGRPPRRASSRLRRRPTRAARSSARPISPTAAQASANVADASSSAARAASGPPRLVAHLRRLAASSTCSSEIPIDMWLLASRGCEN